MPPISLDVEMALAERSRGQPSAPVAKGGQPGYVERLALGGSLGKVAGGPSAHHSGQRRKFRLEALMASTRG